MKKYALYLLLFISSWACVGTDEITIDKPSTDVDPKIVVSPSTQGVLIGDDKSFTAVYTNEKGETEDVAFEWSSNDESIATVSTDGIASGVKEGSVIITAKYNAIESNQATFNVVNSSTSVTTITVSGTVTMLFLGETTTLSAKAFDLDGNELSNANITWVSMDESLATIDANGKITTSTTKEGTASFYALADGKMSNIYTIKLFDGANVLVRDGVFQGSGGYSVSGAVSLEQQANGDLVVKFADDFMSSTGPGLVVYLSNSKTDVIGQGVELMALPQNSGAFEIDVTAINSNIDITDYEFVMIHCKPFNVLFGSAMLGAVQ